FYDTAALGTLPWFTFLELLSATLMGSPELYLKPAMPNQATGHLYYIGVVGVFLALLARPGTGRRRTLFATSSVALVITLMKLYGIRPVQWIAFLPFLKTIHFSIYFGVLVCFLIAILA